MITLKVSTSAGDADQGWMVALGNPLETRVGDGVERLGMDNKICFRAVIFSFVVSLLPDVVAACVNETSDNNSQINS